MERRIRSTRRVTHSLWTLLLVLAVGSYSQSRAQETTFTVTVEEKTSEHPYFEQGFNEGYVIDGTQGQVLTLVRGTTYTFQMEDVDAIHPFFLTTSEVGGPGAEPYTDGVTGNGATGNATLTFTPTESTPDELYYQCQAHEQMGSAIRVVDEKEASLETIADGLVHPVDLAEAPDESGRLFVVDQTGQIYIVTADGTRLETPFLDVSDRMVALNAGYDERGLLGLAFHPDYADNGRFFVYYSAPLRDEAPDEFDHTSHVSEFQVSDDDPDQADADSEQILMQVDQPQGNHNSGPLAFGPSDGYLYIPLGDGGGADDTGTGHVEDWYDINEGGNGQDVEENLLGSILRIDVNNPSGDLLYGIPDDNPFGDEQYAYGFRNPYRMAFDPEQDDEGTYRLFVGDAGQNLWEEVSIVELGGNYGWNVKEGTHCFDAANPETVPDECPDAVGEGHPDEGAPLIDPIIEFANAGQEGGLGTTVVGGHVYRGTMLEGFDGHYIFGAYSQGQDELGIVWVAEPREEGLWPFTPLQFTNGDNGAFEHFVLGFGQDLDGEVYVLAADEGGPTGNTGVVYRLMPAEPGTPNDPVADVPAGFVLEQNYPNPFNPVTTIRYQLAEAGPVTLTVYDVLGREVVTLVDAVQAAGTYATEWDGRDQDGRVVSSGTYIYRLQAGSFTDAGVMTLLK